MSSPPSGPGRTAPKLYQDFLVFDPHHGRPNILADHVPPVGEGQQLGPGIGSCRHEYTTKSTQSLPPPLDLRPSGSTQYKLATVCKKCRIHADVVIDYSRSTDPCPNAEYPVHHLQRVVHGDFSGQGRIRYMWQCSAPQCQALLHVTFRAPRVSTADKNLLTDTELLKQRYDDVVQQEPQREGIRQATPMDSLSRLRKYIRDSLNPQHTKRVFPANNKRFMEAFGLYGQDCQDLLERLGFKYADWNWSLPDPPEIEDRLQADGNSQREMLEDVEMELLAWLHNISSETGLINPAIAEGWPSANRDLERTLAAQGYHRHVSTRRAAASNEELPYFSSLGALPDFADSLVEFAYDRQTICDPEQQSYYSECLQVISESRSTERLQMKVATLQSQDLVSRRDLSAAYRYLQIHGDPRNVSDERLFELFQARQPDLGVAAAEEARQALFKIGQARQSQWLLNASRQSVDTYEEALSWLGHGVNRETSDESLLAVLTMKTSDNAASEDIGQKAIATIARARQSNLLNNWLLTGRTDGYTMSVKEALTHLNIDTDLKDLDPTVFPAIFENARNDRPGEQTEKAIKAIEQALAGQTATETHLPETWPVGLTSHGNTCYLNSLLQYYFSIKPLRDIILNYEQYKMDTSANATKSERVGQRPISMVEIKGGQRFAEDLKHLFERMIKESGTAVKPEEDLVCRAFLPPSEYALLAPGAMEIKQQAGIVNSGPDAANNEHSSHIEDAIDARNESDASSGTLHASDQGEDADVAMVNAGTGSIGGVMPPTPPASPGLKPVDNTQPKHAPPLPPRRFSTTKEQALALAQEKARQQQDVTEVHDSVMWRLRSGMKPEGQDEAGEQWDKLRALFSIGMTETAITNGHASKPVQLFDNSIQLNVPEEATDLNTALDEVFDLQGYEENADLETYKSIRSLPPLLQISIPRIGFDKKTGQAFKSDKTLRLEDELWMDRFCDNSDPQVLPRRKAYWDWRKKLRALRKEQKTLSETTADADLDGPSAVAETAKYLNDIKDVNRNLEDIGLEGIDTDEALSAALISESKQQAERLATLSGEAERLQKQIDSQFADLKNLPRFRLSAVFFHRGAAGHGHYWIYIKDFTENIWRSYNDERVEDFQKLEEIYEAKTWNHGTPTYAVYVRDDNKICIQPVCRNPEKPPTPEPTWPTPSDDVQMHEATEEAQPMKTIDPKLIQEGGQSGWDAPRQVAEASW